MDGDFEEELYLFAKIEEMEHYYTKLFREEFEDPSIPLVRVSAGSLKICANISKKKLFQYLHKFRLNAEQDCPLRICERDVVTMEVKQFCSIDHPSAQCLLWFGFPPVQKYLLKVYTRVYCWRNTKLLLPSEPNKRVISGYSLAEKYVKNVEFETWVSK